MKHVLKFPLAKTHQQTIDLPADARIVACQPQHEEVTLWAICDPIQPRCPRTVTCVSTGQVIPDDAGQYVGTCQFHDGRTVVHAFLGGEHAQA